MCVVSRGYDGFGRAGMVVVDGMHVDIGVYSNGFNFLIHRDFFIAM